MINIHKLASRIIRTVVPSDLVKFRKNTVEISDSGIAKIVHGEWKVLHADVEPGIVSSFGGKNVSEKTYNDLGLDMSHEFYTLWVSDCEYQTIVAQDTCDQVMIRGMLCNIIQSANWISNNGWRRMYCERVIDDDNNA